jgi:hypothetical protein
MTNADRPDPFANLKKFKPKEDEPDKAISSDIDAISEANNWPSRDPVRPQAPQGGGRRPFGKSAEPPKVQFNIRVDEEDKERFYRIAEQKGIQKLGILFKECLDALEASESKR